MWLVKETDGNWSGPFESDLLQKRLSEGSLSSSCELRHFDSGLVGSAATMLASNAQAPFRPEPTAYADRVTFKEAMTSDSGLAEVVGAVIFSLLGIGAAFLVPAAGIGTAVIAAIYAYRAGEKDYPAAIVGQVAAGLSLVTALVFLVVHLRATH